MSKTKPSAEPNSGRARKTARPSATARSRPRVKAKATATKTTLTKAKAVATKQLAPIQLIAGELQPGETNPAAQACNDFLLLGPGRRLTHLHHIYVTWDQAASEIPADTDRYQQIPNSGKKPGAEPQCAARVAEQARAPKQQGFEYRSIDEIPSLDELFPRPTNVHRLRRQHDDAHPLLYTHRIRALPPSQSYQTLKQWAARYGWNQRAVEYDNHILEIQVAEHEREMSDGISLSHMRIRYLKMIFHVLVGQLFAEDDKGNFINLWVRDVKMVGGGEESTIATTVRYNAPLIRDIRSLLDDVAKECGGRQDCLDSLIRSLPWDRLPERYLQRMHIQNPREVLSSLVGELCEMEGDEHQLLAQS